MFEYTGLWLFLLNFRGKKTIATKVNNSNTNHCYATILHINLYFEESVHITYKISGSDERTNLEVNSKILNLLNLKLLMKNTGEELSNYYEISLENNQPSDSNL